MLASGSDDGKIKLWKLYNKEKIEKLKNETSTVCLLLLQSIQHSYKQGRPTNLLGFPKLKKEVFEKLKDDEKKLVRYLLSDIERKRKKKKEKK